MLTGDDWGSSLPCSVSVCYTLIFLSLSLILTKLDLSQFQFFCLWWSTFELPCIDFLVSTWINAAYWFAAICICRDYFLLSCHLSTFCSSCPTQACIGVLQSWPASQLHCGWEHAHQHERGHAHLSVASQWRWPAGPGETGPLPEAPQLHEQNPPAHTPGPSWGIWLVRSLHHRVYLYTVYMTE